MSLKSKLITTISMFVLVLAMTIVGVFAVTSATINMGGNITFVADDINAIVTGKIEGANETHVLDTLTYSATQEPEGDVSTWVGNNLTFKQDTKEPIKITVTVENKSTERWLIVRVEDKTGTIENLNRGITKGGSSYTQNTDVALKPSTGDRTSEVEFVITLSLADSNKSVASAPYSYIIHLNNSNEEPEQPAEPQELDFTFAGGMVSGYNGTETDITLPSSYSLVEVPLNELEVSLDEYYTEQGAAILNAFSGYDVLLANEYKFENVTNQDDLNQKLEQYIQDQGVEVEACFPIKVIYKTEPIIEYTYDEYQRDGDILDGRGETVYKDFFVYLIREMFKFSYAGGEYQTFGIEEFQNYYYLEILDKNGGTIPESYFPLKFKFSNSVFMEGNEIPVTGIATECFLDRSDLTSITIPETYTKIGDSAFSGCSGLSYLTISNNIKEIGSNAFQNCSGLTEIIIPEGVTTIGAYAFIGCSNLTYLEIPSTIEYFGKHGFGSCYALAIIVNRSSQMTDYHENEGYLAREVVNTGSPEGRIEKINNVSYYINDKTGEFVALAPSIFRSEVSEIVIDPRTTYINDYAFYNCLAGTTLTEITISEGVTTIGDSAFKSYTQLKSVIFEDGSKLNEIDSNAFSNCSGLLDITILPSVTIIGSGAFASCTGLKSIIFEEGSQLNKIDVNAFAGCSSLSTITIPAGVEIISYGTFSGCSNLSEIIFLGNVNSIGWSAFSNCSGLIEITIPASVTTIGFEAFFNCNKLKSVIFESNSLLTTIEQRAFADCSSLTSIVIPDNVTEIAGETFRSCSSLEQIDFGNVKIIGASAFEYCRALTTISIPNTVTTIEKKAFQGCWQIKKLELPSSVTTLGDQAFGFGAEEVIINHNITSFGSDAIGRTKKLILGPNFTVIPKSFLGSDCFYRAETIVVQSSAFDGVALPTPHVYTTWYKDGEWVLKINGPGTYTTIEPTE